ncbi:hypothetical protein JXA05_02150 [Candidatus Peregrinibacteria bacterium]|nr:hypothetical protein [Candidatus Peregrinibacteria bacterium]
MEHLNHHEIHDIITQISQSLNCPKCHAKILPHDIKITDISGDECFFDVNCHRCDTEMTLSAHIEKTPNDVAQTYNKSSQILHDNWVEEEISERDVWAIRQELNHFCGSFIEAFTR